MNKIAILVVLLGWVQAARAQGDPPKPATPVSFRNEVMGVLGKAGCNTGPCHGHASGKGGFKLSLRGYDPASDFLALTRHQQGRRVDLVQPANSLLLAKPTGQTSHGGGLRFSPDSELADTLRRWLEAGALDDPGAPRLERLEVTPPERTMTGVGQQQQLKVLAHFNDRRVRDVTRLALYEPTSDGIVEVHGAGVVIAASEGETGVLVRFLGKMALSRFVVIRQRSDFAWKAPPPHNFIDEHVDAKLKLLQVLPSPLVDDAGFLRRVSFDLTGLPPTPEEVRAFLADSSADKRARAIERLLDRPEYADMWALYWLELAGATEGGGSTGRRGLWALHFWLRESFQRNMPFDQFLRQVLTARGSQLENPAVSFARNQLGPKGEVVAQQFLGIRLQCAQCHDHPFDRWTQADYNHLAAFFQGLSQKEGPHDGSEQAPFIAPERFLPWEKDKKATLRFLDGSTIEVPAWRDRREALADWLLGPGKKAVARALVNRVWGKLLGRGIVEPVDDLRFSNPPVNEPLLAALAEDLIAHKWDFKHLVRRIVSSRTYQASSTASAANQHDRTNFSHAAWRRLPAEQLLDALSQVTGVEETFRGLPTGYRAGQVASLYHDSRFLSAFGRSTRRATPCTCERSEETSLPQTLLQFNGDPLRTKMLAKGSRLDRLLASKKSDQAIMEELFLAAWGRMPDERERRVSLEAIRTAASRAEGFEDLFWALLNSRQFFMNH